MTAIAVWCNSEVPGNPSLWIAADSRVSSARTTLIEDAAKVFGLPIVCRKPGVDGFFSDVYYSHTVGYCFAGSTLMGQNVFLGLAPLLSNLVSPSLYIPSLSDIADHALAFLSRSFDDYKQRVGSSAIFEVALFGYCHRTSQLSAFHFAPKLCDGVVTMTLTPNEGMKDRQFIYLGDDKQLMSLQIEKAFGGEAIPGRPLSRIPRYVIQDKIDDETCLGIGGDIQLGIADRFGFRPLTLCKPRVLGQPASYMSYLGRELTPDIDHVGEAWVGMIGMV